MPIALSPAGRCWSALSEPTTWEPRGRATERAVFAPPSRTEMRCTAAHTAAAKAGWGATRTAEGLPRLSAAWLVLAVTKG